MMARHAELRKAKGMTRGGECGDYREKSPALNLLAFTIRTVRLVGKNSCAPLGGNVRSIRSIVHLTKYSDEKYFYDCVAINAP